MSISKLKEDFENIKQHCINIVHAHYTYRKLFHSGNTNLLSKVAAHFFSTLADIMHKDLLLQSSKLMDPATTKIASQQVENLTIKLINEQLLKEDLMTQKIECISKKILDYGEKIKPARSKRIAHFDREYQINNDILGGRTEEEVDQFLENLQYYCDEVGLALGLGQLDFGPGTCKGDVVDFLKYIEQRSSP